MVKEMIVIKDEKDKDDTINDVLAYQD